MALPPTRLTYYLYACRPLPADLLAQLARHGCLEPAADRDKVLALIAETVAVDPAEAPRVGPTLQDRVAQALLASPYLSPKGRHFAAEPPFPAPRKPTRSAWLVLAAIALAFGSILFLLSQSVIGSSLLAREAPIFIALLVYLILLMGRLKLTYGDLPPQATYWPMLITPYWYTAIAGALAGGTGGVVAGRPAIGALTGLILAFVHRGLMAAWRRIGVA